MRIVRIFMLWLAALLATGEAQAQALPWGATVDEDPEDGCVVLLHGLWRTRWSMIALQWHLARAGYHTVNLSYPSLLGRIEQNAEVTITRALQRCAEGGQRQVNFVTHSLGGILVRQYLRQHRVQNLHRVVMLGPPNQGSALADFVLSLEWPAWLLPDAIEQLGTGEGSLPRALGPVDFELGIIAGVDNWLEGLPGFPRGPGDGTVSLAETLVLGASDVIQLPVTHTFMLLDGGVFTQVEHFLRHGRFARREED